METRIPLTQPDIGLTEIAAIIECLKSGRLASGSHVAEFECRLAAHLNVNEVVAVNSATSGLYLVLKRLGIGPGDEVITTVHTFTATAEAIERVGARPVFVDIDPATWQIDPDQIATAISERTKAIMPVHFGGWTADMQKIWAIARHYHLEVIEDAAHALPACYADGRRVGAGDSIATVFSFHATKTMTTIEGGAIATRDARLAELLRLQRLHGIDLAHRQGWKYQVIEAGDKCNLPNLLAALGLAQLERLPAMHHCRANIATLYHDRLHNLRQLITLPPANYSRCSWYLYPILLDSDRDQVIEAMAAQGIECGVHYIPLHLHPYWSFRYDLTSEQFPVSTRIFQHSISLPMSSVMTVYDAVEVVETLVQSIRPAIAFHHCD